MQPIMRSAAEVIDHYEQAELRDAQASFGKRGVIFLCDSACRRAQCETNAIAASLWLRKLLAAHVPVLTWPRLRTTALCAKNDNSKLAVQ